MKNNLFRLIAFSILIEAIITYVNQFFVSGGFSWEMFMSIAPGVLVSAAYGLDLPSYFNLNSRIATSAAC